MEKIFSVDNKAILCYHFLKEKKMRLKLLEKIRSKGIMQTEFLIEDYYDELTERKNEAWYLFSRFVDDSEKENFRKIIEKAINGDVKAYQKLCEIIKIALDKISKLDIRKDGVNVVMTYDSTHEQYLDVDKFIMNTKSEFDAYYGYIKKGFEEILNNKEYLAPTPNITKGINEELWRDGRVIECDLRILYELFYKMRIFDPDVQFEIEYLKEDIPRFKKNIESDPSLYSLMKPEYIDRLCHFLCKESKIARDILGMNDTEIDWKNVLKSAEEFDVNVKDLAPYNPIARLRVQINHKKIVEHNNLITKLYDILNNKFETHCWYINNTYGWLPHYINNKSADVNLKDRIPIEDKYLTAKDSSKVLRRAILRLVYLKGEYEKLNKLSDYMYQETDSLIKYVLATYKEKAYHKNKSIDTLFAYFNYIHFLRRMTGTDETGLFHRRFSKECRQLASNLLGDYFEYYDLDSEDTKWKLHWNSPYSKPRYVADTPDRDIFE